MGRPPNADGQFAGVFRQLSNKILLQPTSSPQPDLAQGDKWRGALEKEEGETLLIREPNIIDPSSLIARFYNRMTKWRTRLF
jgi:hypothetical protein